MSANLAESRMTRIKAEWKLAFDEMNARPSFQRILNSKIELKHYQSILRQAYYHARERPQVQAFATVFFRGHQRKHLRTFFRDALSEIGHDELALLDLKNLGVETSNIPFERPLPSTMALIAYGYYQVQHLNPVGYLGYLLHFDFMPAYGSRSYLEALQKSGIPREAMAFFHDSSGTEFNHNKFLEAYVDDLVKNESDLEAVIYAMRTTSRLYELMIAEAIEEVENPHPITIPRDELRQDPIIISASTLPPAKA